MNSLSVGINPYFSSVTYNKLSDIGRKSNLFVNKSLVLQEISIAEDPYISVFSIGLEFQNKVIESRFEACKTFEADIIGLATSPVTAEFGHLTLADGSKKFITRWDQEIGFGPRHHLLMYRYDNSAQSYSRIEKIRESTFYEKKLSSYVSLMKKNREGHTDTSWTWFDIAKVVTGIVLTSFVVLGNFFAAGVTVSIGFITLLLLYVKKNRDSLIRPREIEQNKKLELELAKELGSQAVLDAQEYYLQGPGPRADYIVRQAFSYATKACKPMDASSLQKQLDFNQAMQTAFVRMKTEDPVKAARIVAKLFQGQFQDAEVIAYKEVINPAYELLCV